MQPAIKPRDMWEDWFPARITAVVTVEDVLVYSWSELTRDAGDVLIDAVPGRQGDAYNWPAVEMNNRSVPIGTVQFLRSRGSAQGLIYEFIAGGSGPITPGITIDTFPGAIGEQFDPADGFATRLISPGVVGVKLLPGGGPNSGPAWQPVLVELVTKVCPLFSDFDGSTYSAENKDGAAFGLGTPVASHSSGVGLVRANATDNLRNAVGLATLGVGNGHAETVQTNGTIKLLDWSAATGTPTLAPNALYFLDPVVPGKMTVTPPTLAGQVSQQIGRAIAPDTMALVMGYPILL